MEADGSADLVLVGNAQAGAPAPVDPFPGAGKLPKRDDPGPVRNGLTAAQKKDMAAKKEKDRVRDNKLDQAGAVAARELKAAQVGVVRSSLFDANDFKAEHAARQARMESTFSRLYKPQANEYWVKKTKAPPRKPPPGQLPAYTNALPAALSLQHPSSREQRSDSESDDDDDEPAAAAAPAATSTVDFDPMAEPRRFYAEFKGRVAALKTGVKDNPIDRPTQAATQPRVADEVIAAATRKSPPPPPPPPPQLEAPTWAMGGGSSMMSVANPILDEDFDVEPSLVYTDSAHYLADHGVQIPMWDEVKRCRCAIHICHHPARAWTPRARALSRALNSTHARALASVRAQLDSELAQLDAAHESAMKSLAIRSDDSVPPATDGLPS